MVGCGLFGRTVPAVDEQWQGCDGFGDDPHAGENGRYLHGRLGRYSAGFADGLNDPVVWVFW